MLWATIDKIDSKLKDNTKSISAYQNQIESLKRYIARATGQIIQAKKENLSLQHAVNNLLLTKLSQYPI